VALAMGSSASLAADKNGVPPNAVSLPSGPGSTEGMGEAFQPMLNSGTARYAVNVVLPARITDVAGGRVYRWLLETSTDPNGNVITYRYAAIPGSNNQRYLREIRYSPRAPPWGVFYFVSLFYEQKPDWRKDYRSGFLVRTAHRLARIDIGIQGVQPGQCAPGDWNEDGTPDALISRYSLDYGEGASHIAQLTRITRYGADGVYSREVRTPGCRVQGRVMRFTDNGFDFADIARNSATCVAVTPKRSRIPLLARAGRVAGAREGAGLRLCRGRARNRNISRDYCK